MTDVKSPETYIGTDRAENFASPGGADQDYVHAYTAPATLAFNQWALTGDWRVGGQDAVLTQPDGGITYRETYAPYANLRERASSAAQG